MTKQNKGGIILDKSPPTSVSELEAHMVRLEKMKYVMEHHENKIWQNEKGKWLTMYRGPDGKRKRLEYISETKLYDKLFELYKQFDNAITVEDVYNDWMRSRITNEEVSRSTIERNQSDWKRFFVSTGWNQKEIRKITVNELESFIKETVKSLGLTQKAYMGFKTLIHAIWSRAHKDELTTISPRIFFDEFKIPKRMLLRIEKNSNDEVFSDNERDILVSYLREHPDTLNQALLLVFKTGLRCGELVALKKEDFVADCYLYVHRTETRALVNGVSETVVEDHAKTEAGTRMVFLDDEAVNIVVSLINSPFAKNSEWLLVGESKHKRIIRPTVRHRLERVCKKCGIKYRSPHKIRKTYASGLIDAKVDDNIIIDQLGHTDIKTTKNYYYYTHQNNEVKIEQLTEAIQNW